MARSTKAPVDPDDAPLKRLGGGRWQTRDERFTIEPQSGTWVVVDGDQTDDLGMPLVRGPFPSLTAAKEAIAGARSTAPATSPLADRMERRRTGRASAEEGGGATEEAGRDRRPKPGRADGPGDAAAGKGAGTSDAPGEAARRTAAPSPAAEEAREPAWLADLDAPERGRARRLIGRLAADGIPDAEGLVRRDVVGGVPSLAAHAVARRLAGLGPGAAPADVARLLADGRDDQLGVRWRLVDGQGRPILLDPGARRRG